jgi:hypothetical protein
MMLATVWNAADWLGCLESDFTYTAMTAKRIYFVCYADRDAIFNVQMMVHVLVKCHHSLVN